jgi:hypothetical protein
MHSIIEESPAAARYSTSTSSSCSSSSPPNALDAMAPSAALLSCQVCVCVCERERERETFVRVFMYGGRKRTGVTTETVPLADDDRSTKARRNGRPQRDCRSAVVPFSGVIISAQEALRATLVSAITCFHSVLSHALVKRSSSAGKRPEFFLFFCHLCLADRGFVCESGWFSVCESGLFSV